MILTAFIREDTKLIFLV